VSDDLGAVLDDATYNGDATEGAAVTGDRLTWSGPLAVGATITIAYSVTVDRPDTGDKQLRNVVELPGSENSNCTAGSTDPACRTSTPVQQFTVAKEASAGSVRPGDTVSYTITVANTGQAPFTGDHPASYVDDLTDVLDDATYNDDATNGAVYRAPQLAWSGALAVGGAARFTYSVTVDDPDRGDGKLLNVVTTPGETAGGRAGNCPADDRSTGCSTSTGVEGAQAGPPPAQTGTDTGRQLLLGGLLLLLGGLLVAAGRRRRQGGRA
jgi:uncharacterized repeat protein (TIGR01451 family)/LPXTG-motif cell wall-anchored protein